VMTVMRKTSSPVFRHVVATVPFVVHPLVTATCATPLIPASTPTLHCIPMTRTGCIAGRVKITPRFVGCFLFALLESTAHHPSHFSLSAFSRTHRIGFSCVFSRRSSSSAFSSSERSISSTVPFPALSRLSHPFCPCGSTRGASRLSHPFRFQLPEPP